MRILALCIVVILLLSVLLSCPREDASSLSGSYGAETSELLTDMDAAASAQMTGREAFINENAVPETVEPVLSKSEAVAPIAAEPVIVAPIVVEIVISAAGDCALGGDLRSGPNGFMREYNNRDGDFSYFLGGVSEVFSTDDLTIVNLEGTFTESRSYVDKTYALSGPPELVEILTSGCVDVVTIANNHSMDYLRAGYDDTVSVLEEAGIQYFGDEYETIVEVKGVRIGLFGYTLWYGGRAIEEKISDAVSRLRESGADIVIAYYHWGLERVYYPSQYQIELAHHTINAGADLVLGSHPHVLQGIEEYRGRNIVYSLGNFCFGANQDPDDKDTVIYRHTFTFTDGELTGSYANIIPCSISSTRSRNDYRPTLLEGSEAERVMEKIERLGTLVER